MSGRKDNKILVVNDDVTQLCMLAGILKGVGYTVFRAFSAREALKICKQSGTPDVILTDLEMPEIDGWQFCKILRSQEHPDLNQVPIMALSAVFEGVSTESILADLGANDFMTAPFEREELLSKVENLLLEKKGVLRRTIVVACITDKKIASFLSEALDEQEYSICKINDKNEIAEYNLHISDGMVIVEDRPGVLDGTEIIHKIRKNGYQNSIIAIATESNRAGQLMKSGADACGVWPVDKEYLNALCEHARQEQALRNVKKVLDERTWQLQESKERYRLMMESMYDPVYICSTDYSIEYLNTAAVTLASTNTIKDKCYNTIFGKSSPCPWCKMKTIVKNEAAQLEFESEELEKSFHGSASPLRHPDGSLSYLAILRDITEEKHLKSQLRQAEKMEAIGQLAGGIAHDFNNMLGAILGYAEMIDHDNRDDDKKFINEKLGTRIRTIITASERASRLVTQLLAFSRQGKYQNVPVDIHKTIHEVIVLLEHTIDKRIIVVEKLNAVAPIIIGDPPQVQSALLNLALNARDAMPRGGQLSFITDQVTFTQEQQKDETWKIKPGSYMKIIVEDTGVGMEDTVKNKIFDPFFTTKSQGKGTGLGLASVYGTIKNHEGYIEVESEIGVGTSFVIYLPLTNAPALVGSSVIKDESILQGEGYILVIDDEEQVLEVTSDMLNSFGYKVVKCNSALKAIEHFQAEQNEINLVLLDMNMPELNGYECLLKLKEIKPDVSAIIATGYMMDDDVRAALAAGVQGVVKKPFKRDELSQLVHTVLDDEKQY